MVRNIIVIKLSLLVIILALVAGCTSQEPDNNQIANRMPKVTSTPEPIAAVIPETGLLCKSSLANIQLPDGSDFYVSALTQISILEFPNLTAEAPRIRMLLEKGKMVVFSSISENVIYLLESPLGALARLSGGYMVVEYDEENQEFFAHCLNGLCEIGPGLDSFNLLESNHTGAVNQAGEFTDLGEITPEDLISGCEDNHLVLEIPATPTPDFGATATAFCGAFEADNPGTPCP